MAPKLPEDRPEVNPNSIQQHEGKNSMDPQTLN